MWGAEMKLARPNAAHVCCWGRVKKAVSELTLDKQILKEALSGKY
jgi:hypothetical protein